MDVIEELQNTIKDNPVILFMKGTPDQPQCGFSMRTAEAIKSSGVNFGYVDVLATPEVRENLPKVSNWPTFPQLFINGELIGGCDIVLDLYQRGELQSMLQEAAPAEE